MGRPPFLPPIADARLQVLQNIRGVPAAVGVLILVSVDLHFGQGGTIGNCLLWSGIGIFMIDLLFSDLHQARQSAPAALDNAGRTNAPIIAVVTANADPENRRRIKVSDPAAPGLDTDWLRRLTDSPFVDPPLPPIGSTVLVMFVDGDPTNGWYLSCTNDTNPPQSKGNAIADFWAVVKGEATERTDKDRTINVGGSLRLQTDGGAYIELAQNGNIVLGNGSGATISLVGSEIIHNAPSITAGGKQVATIDALDNGGHVLINKGWG